MGRVGRLPARRWLKGQENPTVSSKNVYNTKKQDTLEQQSICLPRRWIAWQRMRAGSVIEGNRVEKKLSL
jgi:hypothetical protein